MLPDHLGLSRPPYVAQPNGEALGNCASYTTELLLLLLACRVHLLACGNRIGFSRNRASRKPSTPRPTFASAKTARTDIPPQCTLCIRPMEEYSPKMVDDERYSVACPLSTRCQAASSFSSKFHNPSHDGGRRVCRAECVYRHVSIPISSTCCDERSMGASQDVSRTTTMLALEASFLYWLRAA